MKSDFYQKLVRDPVARIKWRKASKKMKSVRQFSDYTIVKLSKGHNKFRTIYMPKAKKATSLKKILPEIKSIYQHHVVYDIDHAFVGGKNCVTNALVHLPHRYVLSLDIDNFFDSIRSEHVSAFLPKYMIEQTFIDNALPQGFATSPMIANIAMIPVDKMLIEQIIHHRLKNSSVLYSRYADDLTFSFNHIAEKGIIIAEVIRILRHFNLKINRKKIKLYDKQHGRAIVTGVAIDFVKVYPTRKTLKRIRAARHQQNKNALAGLVGWSLCKLPHSKKVSKQPKNVPQGTSNYGVNAQNNASNIPTRVLDPSMFEKAKIPLSVMTYENEFDDMPF